MTRTTTVTATYGPRWLLICDAPGCTVSLSLGAPDEATMWLVLQAAGWTHDEQTRRRVWSEALGAQDLCPEHRRRRP